MECKGASVSASSAAEVGFNRDIVECKAVPETGRSAGGRKDLIETLWNVKK